MNCRVAKSVVFLLIPLLAFCVQKATAQCTPPTGTSFSESFGNYSGGDPCWPGGASSCLQSWKVIQGASYAIAASPTGAACPNSLKLTANATRVKLQTDGTFPALTAGTSYDVYIVFETDALLSGNALIYDLYDRASGGYAVNISVGSDGKSLYAWDQGGTISASIPFSLNAWHTAHVHVDAILANSYLQIDGGSTVSFAPVSHSPQIMEVYGTATGNIYFQSIYINSSLGGGWPPSALMDMSGGSIRTTATPSNLANSTHCGNGSWAMEGGPYLVFSSTFTQSYPALQNACGMEYQNNTGLSLKYDFALQGAQTNNAQANYTYSSVYNTSSAGTYILFDLPATDTHFMSSYTLAVPGGDYAVATEHGTGSSLQLVIECSTPPERYGAINIKPGTWYWVSLDFNLGGATHYLNVYSTDMSLVGSASCPSAATAPASLLILGLSGGEPTPASGGIYYSGPILDYADAVFPLLPPSGTVTPVPPAITSANNATFTLGALGSFTVTATGTLSPTLSETGALPGGVSFNAATGALSGTPQTGTSGTYPIQFTATNSASSASQNFTLTVIIGQAATPTFSPLGGTYTTAQTVSISEATSGATIYYTTDGSSPTNSSTAYTAPISVSKTTTISAMATATGYSNSVVGVANYTLQAPTPTFSPAAGTYSTAQSVTISDTLSGVSIYYTTNGSAPTTSSTLYSTPISVSSTTTINAIAVFTGWSNSSVGSATYTLQNQNQLPTPTFTPGTGTYSSAQTVTISDTASGASIYYTTNGTTPTASSTLYTGPISVATTTTVRAIAALAGSSNSLEGSATYTIQSVAPPRFSPAAGTYTAPQSVSISDSTAGTSIYYTTDGTTPSTASAGYVGLVPVTKTMTIRAIAAISSTATSSVASATYTLQVSTPVLSPGAGTYNFAQSVTMSDATSGSSIFYTTDGSAPSGGSTLYTGPVPVTQSMTFKAIAVLTGWSNSSVASAVYTLQVPQPTFGLPNGNYRGAQSVTISDTLAGVSIYYTTDGSTPTAASTPYTGPIVVSTNTTIKAIAALAGWSNSTVPSGKYRIH